jgi:hypothetical protein
VPEYAHIWSAQGTESKEQLIDAKPRKNSEDQEIERKTTRKRWILMTRVKEFSCLAR